MSTDAIQCELCHPQNEDLVFANAQWRVILVDDANYPGFCRVIWNDHVREMTDLDEVSRNELMQAVWNVEAVIRDVLQPHKINLASLGNMVAHLHWHLIPRYTDDRHFPQPIWAAAQPHTQVNERLAERRALLPQLRQALVLRFQHA
ncbi:MAG: HIT family protein [Burkholderiales bacterium]|nr:HIT family protein [Burkholderiales bacterium]